LTGDRNEKSSKMNTYTTHSVAQNVRDRFLSFAEISVCLVATSMARYQQMSPPLQYEPIIMRLTVDMHHKHTEG
jgi:hypothetical protein